MSKTHFFYLSDKESIDRVTVTCTEWVEFWFLIFLSLIHARLHRFITQWINKKKKNILVSIIPPSFPPHPLHFFLLNGNFTNVSLNIFDKEKLPFESVSNKLYQWKKGKKWRMRWACKNLSSEINWFWLGNEPFENTILPIFVNLFRFSYFSKPHLCFFLGVLFFSMQKKIRKVYIRKALLSNSFHRPRKENFFLDVGTNVNVNGSFFLRMLMSLTVTRMSHPRILYPKK